MGNWSNFRRIFVGETFDVCLSNVIPTKFIGDLLYIVHQPCKRTEPKRQSSWGWRSHTAREVAVTYLVALLTSQIGKLSNEKAKASDLPKKIWGCLAMVGLKDRTRTIAPKFTPLGSSGS